MNIKSLLIAIALSSAPCIGADAILDFTNGVNTSPVVTPTSTGARITFNSTTSTNLNALKVTNGVTVGGEVVAAAFAGDISRTTGSAWINANAVWGVKGDGVTDNTEALLTMRTWLRSNDNSRIIFTNGTYLYTNNAWLKGVRNLELDGGNATFQNVRTGAVYGTEMVGLVVNQDFFNNHGDGVYASAAEEGPVLIQTVTANSSNVTLLTASETNKFTAGKPALVYGWTGDNSGYPPSPYFFEFVDVVGFDSGGVVLFTNKLKNSYDQSWYGIQGASHGAPAAILPLYRANFAPYERIVLRNLKIGASPGISPDADPNSVYLPMGGLSTFAGLDMVLDNVESAYLSAGQSRNLTVKNSRFKYIELDKIGDTVAFEDSDIYYYSGGNCINNLRMDRCTIREHADFDSRQNWLSQCLIFSTNSSGAQLAAATANSVSLLSIKDSVFFQQPGYSVPLVNGGGIHTLTVDSSSSATNLIATDTGASWRWALFPGKKLSHVLGTNYGYILNVKTNSNATNFVIEASFTRQPIAGEEYRFSNVKEIVMAGNRIIGASSAPEIIYQNAEVMNVDSWTATNSYAAKLNSTNATPFGNLTLNSNLMFATDNAWNIGGDGVSRPKNIYVAEKIGIAKAPTYNVDTDYTINAGIYRVGGYGGLSLAGAVMTVGNTDSQLSSVKIAVMDKQVVHINDGLVGILTNNPQAALHVVGDIIADTARFGAIETSGTNAGMLELKGAGGTSTNITFNGSNGIATALGFVGSAAGLTNLGPQDSLMVSNRAESAAILNANFVDGVKVFTDFQVVGQLQGNGGGLSNITTAAGWTNTDSTNYTANRVGIGTNNPQAKVHVITTNGASKVLLIRSDDNINDMVDGLWLSAGSDVQRKRYITYGETNSDYVSWRNGINASNDFILYDNRGLVHPIYIANGSNGGDFLITSPSDAGTVRINWNESGKSVGTNGLIIYSGLSNNAILHTLSYRGITLSTGSVTVPTAGGFQVNGRAFIGASASGVVRIGNENDGALTRLNWGGTGRSTPALRAVGSGLVVCSADGSYNRTNDFTVSGSLIAGVTTVNPYSGSGTNHFQVTDTNGVSIFNVTSNELHGIGTNLPQAKVHIVGDGSTARLQTWGTTAADSKAYVDTNGNINSVGYMYAVDYLAGSSGTYTWNKVGTARIGSPSRGVSISPGVGNGTNHFQVVSTNSLPVWGVNSNNVSFTTATNFIIKCTDGVGYWSIGVTPAGAFVAITNSTAP